MISTSGRNVSLAKDRYDTATTFSFGPLRFRNARWGENAAYQEVFHGWTHLYTVECSPDCGFKVQDHNSAELTDIVKLHASKSHNKTMSDKEIQGMMKTVRT